MEYVCFIAENCSGFLVAFNCLTTPRINCYFQAINLKKKYNLFTIYLFASSISKKIVIITFFVTSLWMTLRHLILSCFMQRRSIESNKPVSTIMRGERNLRQPPVYLIWPTIGSDFVFFMRLERFLKSSAYTQKRSRREKNSNSKPSAYPKAATGAVIILKH